jgi:hypothetical protein
VKRHVSWVASRELPLSAPGAAWPQTLNSKGVVMELTQDFFLGMMVAWTPSLIVLAVGGLLPKACAQFGCANPGAQAIYRAQHL